MPKKQMSEAARKAASERMKAWHAAKKENNVPTEPEITRQPDEEDVPVAPDNPPTAPVVPPTVTLSQEQFQMMLDRLQGMENKTSDTPKHTINSQGGVVGVIERYPTDPRHYVNPVEELYETPELRRFGLRENYVLEWKVTPTKYQTAMGTWYVEPRFELTLKRKQFDDNNEEIVKYDDHGKAYNPRIVLGRSSFFEDPPANIIEADQAGVSMDDLDQGEFQEKMRMYRYKFWLVEQLTPKRPNHTTNHSKQQVIGGRVYEIEDYSMPI